MNVVNQVLQFEVNPVWLVLLVNVVRLDSVVMVYAVSPVFKVPVVLRVLSVCRVPLVHLAFVIQVNVCLVSHRR